MSRTFNSLLAPYTFTIEDGTNCFVLREHWGTATTDNGKYELSRSLQGDVVIIKTPPDHPVLKGQMFLIRLGDFLDAMVDTLDARKDRPTEED